jgi:periplasmic protein CpxP/Spy
MKKRIIVIASIAALVIGATIFAVAQGPEAMKSMHGYGPHGHGDMLEHMARELNLTDAQKQQVKAIMESAESSAQGIHAKLEETHKQLEAATANGQFDEAQVRTLANQQAQLEADMMVEHLRAKSKVFGILTAEQRVKAEEMHQRMGPHRRPGPPDGPRQPPPPGL